jgi:hypothetical protein
MTYAPGEMIESDWKACRVLNLSEKHRWGDPKKICRSVVRTLDEALSTLGISNVLVTAGTAGEHSKGSYHYPTNERLGMAIDFMLPYTARDRLPDIFIDLLRFPLSGVGAYSEWRLASGLPAIGGFHVDTRPTGKKALWLRGRDGQYAAARMAAFAVNFT